jgi:hypothetical protein
LPGRRRTNNWLALLLILDRPSVAAGGTKRSRLARAGLDVVAAAAEGRPETAALFFSAAAGATALMPAFLNFGLFLGIIPVNPRQWIYWLTSGQDAHHFCF